MGVNMHMPSHFNALMYSTYIDTACMHRLMKFVSVTDVNYVVAL